MKNNNWAIVVLVIVSIWFWGNHHKLSNQIEDLDNQVYYLENEKQDYSDALDEANSNIEDAKWYAWESYEDMGYALDDLETVNP